MRSARRIGLIVASAVILGALGLSVAYAVDAPGDGRVGRNVTLAGKNVSGLDAPTLQQRVDALAADYAATSLVIGKNERFSVPAAGIDLRVDSKATVASALRTGRTGAFPRRVVQWTTSFVRPQRAPVKIEFDETKLRSSVQKGDPSTRKEAVEPAFAVEDNRLVAVPGVDGRGIDPKRVASKLPGAATLGAPLRIELSPSQIEPRFTEQDARRLADRMEDSVVAPLRARAGTTEKDIPAELVRSWLTTVPGDDALQATTDAGKVRKGLEDHFGDAGTKPTEPHFEIVFNQPVVMDGQDGSGCCADAAVAAASAAIDARIAGSPTTGVVELPLRPVPPSGNADDLRKLGITQAVGTFTTAYAAGQPRVTNIHRISDLTRGSVIKPGETFSINGAVGRRTLANGFVVDGVIEDGKFAQDVGGGISQYATTLFNAAFFGGLDFGEYQSHTIYISRYPYGREATVAFPHPDLQIRNTTPYGVLIWPTYSDRTITVTLYSTPYASGAQTGQSESKVGACTKVTTQRTRTYNDGRTAVDSVSAIYQPEEGKKC